mmetsp:Transcript_10323/g.17013  ORF Transcript_10323/g.17013 Transcript_10323/m.17013 type:complete len:401 (-) Transcript_10323:87-1289(-)
MHHGLAKIKAKSNNINNNLETYQLPNTASEQTVTESVPNEFQTPRRSLLSLISDKSYIMLRFLLCGLCVVICVALQLGWKEVAASYRLNFMKIPSRTQNNSLTEDGEEDSEGNNSEDLLYWTDIYASLGDEIDSSSFDASTISEIDQLIAKESSAFMATSPWHLIHNETGYTVESLAVKSNSMSVTENPMIHIRIKSLPCHSAKHMLQQLSTPNALMDTFFPLFHLYESRFAGTVTAVNTPLHSENSEFETEAEIDSDEPADESALTHVEESFTIAELRTVIAPLIWPFEEKRLTLLNLVDLDQGLYRSRSVEVTKDSDNTRGYSFATTSMSLVVNITSEPRDDEAAAADCTCQILLHSANILPHPLLNFVYETDYLAPRIADFFTGYSKYFFPNLSGKK